MDNFREWLSDNLRYILLLIGILAVLLALFFGVRALTGARGGAAEVTPEETSAPEDQETAAETTVAPAAEETAAADRGTLTENADPAVSKLISDYYAALTSRDLPVIQEITEGMPEADAVAIGSATTAYSDIHVYTKEGPAPGTMVVFSSYQYQNENQPQPLPGLSQMFVKKGADGNWKISCGEQDAETTAYLESVKNDADVRALIKEVTDEYQAAVKAMEENASAPADASGTPANDAADTASSDGTPAAEGTDGAPAAEQASDPAAVEQGTEEQAEAGGEEGAEAAEAGEETAEEAVEAERGAEIKSSCNVRTGPGYNYQIIGEVRTGTYVTVIGELEDGWWHIRTDYLDGYVGGKFLPEA